MDKTKTRTVDKVTFPLRLPPKMYKQIREKVNEIKENENYAYSINDFLTEIIENGLKEKIMLENEKYQYRRYKKRI